MAISADVLASALQHLTPRFTELFLRGIPLFAYLIGKQLGTGAGGGNLEQFSLDGPYLEFNVLKGGPGQITAIRDGTELINSQRSQQLVRGNEYPFMHLYHYLVPIKDLMEAGGKNDLAKLISKYPEVAVAHNKQLVNRQIARGAGSSGSSSGDQGTNGIFTLNGLHPYSPQGTSRTGLFQFAAPASQTATVHGLAMQGNASGVTGWYHQYDHVNSFRADGMRRWRAGVQKANQEGLMLQPGGIDLICSDQASFLNMLDAVDEKVVIIDKEKYPLAQYLNRQGYKMDDGSDWYWDPDIDLTDTTSFSTAATQAGVTYCLNTQFFKLLIQNQNKEAGGTGMFDMRPHIELPNQPAWQFRILSYWNVYCESLRNQLVLTGTAQE